MTSAAPVPRARGRPRGRRHRWEGPNPVSSQPPKCDLKSGVSECDLGLLRVGEHKHEHVQEITPSEHRGIERKEKGGRRRRQTYGPDLDVLHVPDAAGGVDVAGEHVEDLLAGRGHDHQRAAVEVELGRVVGIGHRVEEGTFCCKKKSLVSTWQLYTGITRMELHRELDLCVQFKEPHLLSS